MATSVDNVPLTNVFTRDIESDEKWGTTELNFSIGEVSDQPFFHTWLLQTAYLLAPFLGSYNALDDENAIEIGIISDFLDSARQYSYTTKIAFQQTSFENSDLKIGGSQNFDIPLRGLDTLGFSDFPGDNRNLPSLTNFEAYVLFDFGLSTNEWFNGAR